MVRDASQILDGLWIGNVYSSQDQHFLRENNISVIINCTVDVPNLYNHIKYYRVSLNDSGKKKDIDKMTKYLPKVVPFLHQEYFKNKKNVLVHCHAGVQRSATVVCAYLTKSTGANLSDVMKFIIKKRPICFSSGRRVNFQESLNKFLL